MKELKNAYVLDACIWPENGRFTGMSQDYKDSLLDACFLTLDGDSFRSGVECLGNVSLLSQDPAEKFRIARTYDDLMQNKKDGVKSMILYFQDPAPLENKSNLAKAFYEMGVRVIQMSYNKGGFIGAGCVEGAGYGLTDFGKRLVKEFNDMGMLIDLSHCGPNVVKDALMLTEKPVTIGHTCCKALADNPRNKTDEQIKALAEVGGVLGLTPWAPICWKRKENVPPTIEDYLDHVCHAVDLVGIDHVGFASDNNLDHNKDLAGISSQGSLYDLVVGGYNKNVSTDPNERHAIGFTGALDVQNLVDAMRKRGFNNEEIEKFLGGNFLRVFREVWK
ncbi:MAG: membrane dipeptidase [Firmicutes bacterium]|nr:membrane dipeptidase [Bacillota bacterium]